MTIKQLLRLFAARLGYAPPVFHVADHRPAETIAELAERSFDHTPPGLRLDAFPEPDRQVISFFAVHRHSDLTNVVLFPPRQAGPIHGHGHGHGHGPKGAA